MSYDSQNGEEYLKENGPDAAQPTGEAASPRSAEAYWPEWLKKNTGLVRRLLLAGPLPALYADFANDFAALPGQPSEGLEQVAPEDLARKFHEAYERLAPQFGYETRKESAKPWTDVPEQNKRLMIAVCSELARHFSGGNVLLSLICTSCGHPVHPSSGDKYGCSGTVLGEQCKCARATILGDDILAFSGGKGAAAEQPWYEVVLRYVLSPEWDKEFINQQEYESYLGWLIIKLESFRVDIRGTRCNGCGGVLDKHSEPTVDNYCHICEAERIEPGEFRCDKGGEIAEFKAKDNCLQCTSHGGMFRARCCDNGFFGDSHECLKSNPGDVPPQLRELKLTKEQEIAFGQWLVEQGNAAHDKPHEEGLRVFSNQWFGYNAALSGGSEGPSDSELLQAYKDACGDLSPADLEKLLDTRYDQMGVNMLTDLVDRIAESSEGQTKKEK